MRSETGVEDLGAVQSRYEVANRRILTVGIVILMVGIGAGVLATLLVTDGPTRWAGNESAIDQTIGITMGLSLLGLLGGALLLVKALRGGLTEFFEVHEHGLVHGSGRRVRGRRWDLVDTINTHNASRSTSVSRFLGNDHRCVIRFSDGGRVRFDGTTDFSIGLEAAVRRHCPSAGPQPRAEQH